MSAFGIYVLRLVAVCLALNSIAIAQSVLVLALVGAEPGARAAPTPALSIPTDARIGYRV